jgi:hypothetical protein
MAISLNGSSQYVSTTNAAACPSAAQNFLLAAWVKTSTTPATTNRAVVGWAEDGANDSVCGIRMEAATGRLGISIKPDGAGALSSSFVAINAADDNWHFVVMWYDHATLTLSGVVDNAASPVTRSLTSGQTLALTRFTAGVQIRAGVDATTYWTGELAEVTFLRGGTYTEAMARSLYNIGIPKRGQAPDTIQARWPLETDANASGGSGPNLTETGTPTYNDNEDTLFDAITGYTAVALTDANAAAIVEGSLQSGTSHYQRVTVPSAGYMAVGWVWDTTDGVSSGQDFRLEQPFGAPATLSTSDPFANKISDYVENQFRFITVPAAGDYMFRLNIPSGTGVLRGMSVRYDASSGVVPMFGNNFHCWPTSVVYGGSVYSVSRGLDNRATLAITKDGVAIYNSDALARVNAGDDTYHSGAALAVLSGGVAVVSVGHNSAMEIAYAADGNFTNAVTWHDVSASGDNTYAVVTVDADDVIHIFNRGTNDASNGYHAQRWTVTDLAGGSPTMAVDHLGGDGTRQYPNTVYRSGTLLAYAWTGAWNWGFAAIYDKSTDRWYDLAKNLQGGASAGTIGTPRFDNTDWTTLQTAGTGLRIYGDAAGTNYQSSALFDLTGWTSPGKAKAGFIYVQTAGTLNEYAATTIKWVVMDGATRYVSGVDFSPPADWTCNLWRVFTAVQWKDNDPATNEAILFIIDHDDREAGGNYDTAAPTYYTPYYDMGGRRFRVYRITNPLSSSPTFTLVASNAPSITNSLTAGFARTVPGRPNVFRWEEASTELHETKRQAKFYEWEYVPPAAPSSAPSQTKLIVGLGLGL